jgi:hypothetical protein
MGHPFHTLLLYLFCRIWSGPKSYARDSLTRSFAASLQGSQTVLPLARGFMQQTTQSPAFFERTLCLALEALS